MKIRTLFLLIAIAAIAVFAVLNWNAFMTKTSLSLGVAVVEAPLGLVMLGIVVFLAVLFLVFVVYLQTSFLLDARRNAKELQSNRELAEHAEASRFTELRGFLDAEMKKQADLNAQSRAAVLARLDQLDRDLRSSVEQTGNTLSAYIDELEDRLERSGVVPRPEVTG
jgi:uncharacterized integral membrane protein